MAKEKLFSDRGTKNPSLLVSEGSFPTFLRLLQHFAVDSVLCFDKRKHERKEQRLMQYEGRGVIVPVHVVHLKLHKAFSIVLEAD